MTPAPATRHQIIVGRLLHLLLSYLETHPVGTVLTAPYDVLLSDTDIVQPDVLYVRNNSKAQVTEKNVQGPPDLVVEILSPGTAARDRDLKRKRYERFGVQEYWPLIRDPSFATYPNSPMSREDQLPPRSSSGSALEALLAFAQEQLHSLQEVQP